MNYQQDSLKIQTYRDYSKITAKSLMAFIFIFLFSTTSHANEYLIEKLGIKVEPAHLKYSSGSNVAKEDDERDYIRIKSINQNSPFFNSGLQPGDIITKITLCINFCKTHISWEFKFIDRPGTSIYEGLNSLVEGDNIRLEAIVDYEYVNYGHKFFTKEYMFATKYKPFEKGEWISEPYFNPKTSQFSFPSSWTISRKPLSPTIKEKTDSNIQTNKLSAANNDTSEDDCEKIRIGSKTYSVAYTKKFIHFNADNKGNISIAERKKECNSSYQKLFNIYAFNKNVKSFEATNNDVLYVIGDLCANNLKSIAFLNENAGFNAWLDPNFYRKALLSQLSSKSGFSVEWNDIRSFYSRYKFQNLEEATQLKPHQFYEYVNQKQYSIIHKSENKVFYSTQDIQPHAKHLAPAIEQNLIRLIKLATIVCGKKPNALSLEARIAVPARYFIEKKADRQKLGLRPGDHLSLVFQKVKMNLFKNNGSLILSNVVDISHKDLFRNINKYKARAGVVRDFKNFLKDLKKDAATAIVASAIIISIIGIDDIKKHNTCGTYRATEFDCRFSLEGKQWLRLQEKNE